MMKRKFLAAAVLAALFVLLLCGAAFAAQVPAKVNQEVIITFAGPLPRPRETLTVVMEALDSGNPMPGGQVGGTYSIEILGDDKLGSSGWFPAITFDHVGTYKYEIWQEPGKYKSATYDDTVYTMTVTVTNSADYKSLEAVVSFRDDEGGPKPDNNLFHNIYKATDGTITPTGVADDWPYYLMASAALMMISLFLMTKLRRREALETDAVVMTMDGEDIDE